MRLHAGQIRAGDGGGKKTQVTGGLDSFLKKASINNFLSPPGITTKSNLKRKKWGRLAEKRRRKHQSGRDKKHSRDEVTDDDRGASQLTGKDSGKNTGKNYKQITRTKVLGKLKKNVNVCPLLRQKREKEKGSERQRRGDARPKDVGQLTVDSK